MKLTNFHFNVINPFLYKTMPIIPPIRATIKKGIKNLKFAIIINNKKPKNINLVKPAKKEIIPQNIFCLFSNYNIKEK